MRVGVLAVGLTVLALGLAATATGGPSAPAAIPGCAKASLNLVEDGQLSLATDNPAFPPWWGGAPKKPWQISNPASGKGYESAVAYAVAKQLGFSKRQVDVERRAVQQLVPARARSRSTSTWPRSRTRPSGRRTSRSRTRTTS